MICKLYTLDNQFIKQVILIPLKLTGIAEWSDGINQWFVDGKLHRLDGHAWEGSNGRKLWYVDGKQVTKEQCELLHSVMKLKGLI